MGIPRSVQELWPVDTRDIFVRLESSRAARFRLTPECLNNDPLGLVGDGDLIHLDSKQGRLEARVPLADWQARDFRAPVLDRNAHGMGRELFNGFRALASDAEAGASSFGI